MLRVALNNGAELHYNRAGSGTTLVFIHGAMGDWRSWEGQWGFFSSAYDCVTYSRRYSHPNRNEMPSPDHSALDEAQDLLLLLDALGCRKAILVGSSYGGFVALALAVAHPERVTAVVAVEPPMMRYAQHSEAGREACAAFRRDTIEPANAAFRAGQDELAGRIMTGGINAGDTQPSSAEVMQRRLQNLRAMKMLSLSTDEFPLLLDVQLAKLPMPVLLVTGENSAPIHREIFKNVSNAMPNAQKKIIAGAGHGVSRQQAALFNEALAGFLRQSVP